MGILNYVPPGYTLDAGQRDLLLAYERLPEGVGVVVINVPVAGGKTLLTDIIGRYESGSRPGGATIVAPTNQLIGQSFHEDGLKYRGWKLAPYKNAAADAPWDVVKKRFLDSPLKMANTMSYLANKAYSRTLLYDEGHTARGFLQDFEGVKLWHHLTPWPLSIRTTDQFLYWLHTDPEASSHVKLRKLISRDPTSFILEQGVEEYRGKDQLCLRVVPLTPKNNRPILWPPSRVKRIVMASATFSSEDLVDIGLDKRWTAWLSMASRIEAARRPLVYDPVAMPTYGRPDEVRKLADGILSLAEWHQGERGLIHVTYNLMSALTPHLRSNSRFIFHNRDNKKAAFKGWQASPDGILLAAGMHEGVNLKYDMCRWQAIAKIAWPSLANEAVRVKAEQRPEWYLWETLKIAMQAYGRVCRMPDDYGVTYVLTEEFARLYKESRKAGLVPQWFSEVVHL